MQLELTAEDRGHLLTITLLPHAPIGDVTERFTFETGLEIQPRFDIPAVGIVTGRYTALEPLVQLGVERGRGASRRLVVERRDGRDGIPLHGIEFDNTLLQVTPDPVSAQRLDLIVEVLPLAPPGRHGTQLRVRFDDPHQPALEIPVFVEVLPSVRLDPAELLADDGAYPTLTIRSPLGEVLCPDAPGADATLTAQGDGVWTLTLDGTPSGPLILHTDVPGEPTVLVPVR